MSTLNYLCKNDISDDDCYRCLIHGIKFGCPKNCPDFEDIRKDMSPEILAERERVMNIMGIKDADAEFDPTKLIPCPKCGYKGASFFLDSDNDEGKTMCVIQCNNHEEYTVNGNPHYHHLCDADVEAETLSEAVALWNRGLAE